MYQTSGPTPYPAHSGSAHTGEDIATPPVPPRSFRIGALNPTRPLGTLPKSSGFGEGRGGVTRRAVLEAGDNGSNRALPACKRFDGPHNHQFGRIW
jgi:hypothetical protein